MSPESATNGKEIQSEDQSYERTAVDENDTVDLEGIEQREQFTPPKPSIRRSTRKHHPLTRYL